MELGQTMISVSLTQTRELDLQLRLLLRQPLLHELERVVQPLQLLQRRLRRPLLLHVHVDVLDEDGGGDLALGGRVVAARVGLVGLGGDALDHC